MAAIDAIGLDARQVLFETMMSVAWADQSLQAEEREAARAAAMSLGLLMPGNRSLVSLDRAPGPPEKIAVSLLHERDRDLVYLCAAWMAMADAVEDPKETELLERIRRHLGMSESRAAWLKLRAVELRKMQAVEPSAWWRAFDKLVIAAAKAIARGDG